MHIEEERTIDIPTTHFAKVRLIPAVKWNNSYYLSLTLTLPFFLPLPEILLDLPNMIRFGYLVETRRKGDEKDSDQQKPPAPEARRGKQNKIRENSLVKFVACWSLSFYQLASFVWLGSDLATFFGFLVHLGVLTTLAAIFQLSFCRNF